MLRMDSGLLLHHTSACSPPRVGRGLVQDKKSFFFFAMLYSDIHYITKSIRSPIQIIRIGSLFWPGHRCIKPHPEASRLLSQSFVKEFPELSRAQRIPLWNCHRMPIMKFHISYFIFTNVFLFVFFSSQRPV